MRSDERSGAVFAALLLLWGTLLAEPLHIYTHYIRKVTEYTAVTFNMPTDTILMKIIIFIVFTATGCFLFKLSDSSFGPFLGTTVILFTFAGYVANSFVDNDISLATVFVFASTLLILAILHLLRNDQILKWAGDFVIASHAVYLLTNFMFVPLSKLGETIGKILYITNYADTDLSYPFDGLIRIPAAVWGSFIALISLLPMVYLAMTRRKS